MGWCKEDESKINLDRSIPPSHFFLLISSRVSLDSYLVIEINVNIRIVIINLIIILTYIFAIISFIVHALCVIKIYKIL